MPGSYFVYILASESRELYIGITNNIVRRLYQHREGLHPESFAYQHKTLNLVCLECCSDARGAIRREKQLKGWTRRKKIALIERVNPEWGDLGEDLR